MRKIFVFPVIFILSSCISNRNIDDRPIITVSIAPFKYFTEAIAGDDYFVNVMVRPGSDPHIYEPFPDQIIKLNNSVGYISNGYLGFEKIWLDRFYETNRDMKKLSLGDKIIPIIPEYIHDDDSFEGADPHYWVSPNCAKVIASSINEFLCELNPEQKDKYILAYGNLIVKIDELDSIAKSRFSQINNKTFFIFHPNLGYLARDYGLNEISLEVEGKEPSAEQMKDLIDMGKEENIKTIFVQKEYDIKNAKSISDEIGAEVEIIDPLAEDWYNSTREIIYALYKCLSEDSK